MGDIAFDESTGWWLPSHEKHLQEWMRKVRDRKDGRLRYQGSKIDLALAAVSDKEGMAIDVGGHVGLWSHWLAQAFRFVVAFEPVDLHRQCFGRNVTADNVLLLPVALGERDGKVSIHTSAGSSGDSWVKGDGDITLMRLDDVAAVRDATMPVRFVKLDCEGYELFALRGAEATLTKHRPVVMVEQKPGRASKFGIPDTAAVDYLRGLGYRLVRELSGDYLMVPA